MHTSWKILTISKYGGTVTIVVLKILQSHREEKYTDKNAWKRQPLKAFGNEICAGHVF